MAGFVTFSQVGQCVVSKTPILRGVAAARSCSLDGSAATLDQVVAFTPTPTPTASQ